MEDGFADGQDEPDGVREPEPAAVPRVGAAKAQATGRSIVRKSACMACRRKRKDAAFGKSVSRIVMRGGAVVGGDDGAGVVARTWRCRRNA